MPNRYLCLDTYYYQFISADDNIGLYQVKIDWPPRIDKFEHVDAMISFGEGPEDFWVNLVDREDKLGQLDAKLQEVYASGGAAIPRVFKYVHGCRYLLVQRKSASN